MIETSKAALCWPNRVDEGVLSSSGDWDSDFPLTNLQNYLLPVKARTDAETTTQITLTIPARTISAIALAAHNLTTTATWRIRLYSDAGGTVLVYDSGVINAWDVDVDTAAVLPPLSFHFADDAYSVQVIVIDIEDDANGDGYLEFGRLIAAPAFQATVNIVYGYAQGLENNTEIQVALDGITEYFDEKLPRRTAVMTFPMLTREEAYLQVERMYRTVGLKGDVLFAKDLLSNSTKRVTTFLARLQVVNAITQPYYDRFAGVVSLIERR